MGYVQQPIARFAYVSVAAPDLSDDDYIALIRRSWSKNRQLKINGILSQVGGEFRQVIEGRPRVVAQLAAAILADKRHSQIEVRQYLLTNSREFTQWTVTGFGWLSEARAAELPFGSDADNVIYSDLFDRSRQRAKAARRGE